jgi:hypothetical protein
MRPNYNAKTTGERCACFYRNNAACQSLLKYMRGENASREAVVEMLRRKWDTIQQHIDERGRLVWAASEAEALGYGGVTIVHLDRMSTVTGM